MPALRAGRRAPRPAQAMMNMPGLPAFRHWAGLCARKPARALISGPRLPSAGMSRVACCSGMRVQLRMSISLPAMSWA
eukprot:250960-Alexandrium_andersonii.AAC.1